jgi:transcription elongation factor GreA
METIPLTKDGFKSLNEELDDLKKVQRPTVIEQIAEARDHGDLKENAEYHAAREKQGFIEGRINELEDKLSRAEVIDFSDDQPELVKFGAWVTVSDEETGDEKKYRIVGDLEADIASNKLSLSTPIARALMGKRVDDLIEVKVPKGTIEYVITEITYS